MRARSRARSTRCLRPAARLDHVLHLESTCSSATPRWPQHHLPAPQLQTPSQRRLPDVCEIRRRPHGETGIRTRDTTIFRKRTGGGPETSRFAGCYRVALFDGCPWITGDICGFWVWMPICSQNPPKGPDEPIRHGPDDLYHPFAPETVGLGIRAQSPRGHAAFKKRRSASRMTSEVVVPSAFARSRS
jgi:hypothetical protein